MRRKDSGVSWDERVRGWQTYLAEVHVAIRRFAWRYINRASTRARDSTHRGSREYTSTLRREGTLGGRIFTERGESAVTHVRSVMSKRHTH